MYSCCTPQEVAGEPTIVVIFGDSGDGMRTIQKIAHTFSCMHLVESESVLRLVAFGVFAETQSGENVEEWLLKCCQLINDYVVCCALRWCHLL